MALSTRELIMILRAKDEASRTLDRVGANILKMGNASKIAALRAQAGALRQYAANRKLAGASKQEIANIEKQAAAYDKQAKSIETSRARTEKLVSTMQDAGRVMTMVGVGMAAAGAVGLYATYNLAKAAVDYQKSVKLTQTQVSGFSVSVQKLGQIGIDAANKFGVAFDEVQPTLYDIFSTMDVNLKQATSLLDAFSKTAVAGNISLQDASRGTMGIMNAFKIPINKVNDVLDKQFELVRAGVGTYGEFNSVIGRVTPSAVRAGQSLDTMDAMMIFLTRNGLSAANASSSAARALDAIANPKTAANMKDLGIKITDVKGNLLPMNVILGKMVKYLDKIPGSANKAKALAEMFMGSGGTIQAMRFFDLAIQPKKYADFVSFLKRMTNSGGAFGKAYKQMASSTANLTQIMKNRWETMKVELGSALLPTLNKLLNIGNEVLNWFHNLSPGTKKVIAQFLLWGSIMAVLGGVLLIVVGTLLGLAAGLITVVGAIAGAPEIFAALAVAIPIIIGFVGGFAAALIALWKNSAGLRSLVKNTFTEGIKVVKAFYYSAIKPMADGFGDLKLAVKGLFQSLDSNLFPLLAQWGKSDGPKIVDAAKKIGKEFGDDLSRAMHFVANLIRTQLMPAFEQFSNFLATHKKEVKEIGEVIGVILVLWVRGLGKALEWLIDILAVGFVTSIMVAIKVIEYFILAVAGISATVSFLVKHTRKSVNDIKTAWNVIKGFFTKTIPSWWDALVSAGKSKLNELRSAVNTRVNQIRSIWNAVKGFFTKTIPGWLESLRSGAMAKINSLRNGINNDVNAIRNIWHAISGIPAQVIGYFERLRSGAVGKVKSLLSYLGGVPGRIRSAVHVNLYGIGQSIMQGLINGIESKLGPLGSALKGVTNFISSHKGPRSYDKVMLKPHGQDIMNGLIGGIKSQLPSLKATLGSVTKQISVGGTTGAVGSSRLVTPTSVGSSKVVNQNFNITTQEISPRKHAADLGWEIARRM